jgi:hypothetical protein
MFGCLNDVVYMFDMLNLLMMYEPCACVKGFVCQKYSANKLFMGIIAGKPSRDFTHPLGMLRGLKGLLHMLNAIVSLTKVDLCFLFLLCFHFLFR